MSDTADTAQVIIRPPIAWALAVLAGLALKWLMPLPFVPGMLPAGWLGATVFALSLVLVAWAIATMTRTGSNVPTSLPATTIVETGPYRFTRNPIYLGMFLGLAGLAVAFDNLWLLATLVPFPRHSVRFTALTAAHPGNIADAEWTEFNDAGLWTVSADKMKMDHEHIVPLSRQALAILEQVALLAGEPKYVFSCSRDQPISDNTLNKRLRDLGYDTGKDHCAHGSTLLNGECDRDGNKAWDGDVIELQLAHLDSSSVRAIYNRTGPMSLMGARTKLMQHWADRVDTMVGENVVPIGKHRIVV
jgi:hypothetical protein